jgi:hypothetical protein
MTVPGKFQNQSEVAMGTGADIHRWQPLLVEEGLASSSVTSPSLQCRANWLPTGQHFDIRHGAARITRRQAPGNRRFMLSVEA